MIWDTVEFWGSLYFQNLQKSAGPRELFGPQTSILWRITYGALRKDWRTDPRTVLSVSTIQKTQMLSKFQSFIIWYICNYIYIIISFYIGFYTFHPAKCLTSPSTFPPFWLVPYTPPLGVPPLIHWVPHRLPKTRRAAAGATQQQQGGGLARKVGA